MRSGCQRGAVQTQQRQLSDLRGVGRYARRWTAHIRIVGNAAEAVLLLDFALMLALADS